MAIISSQSTRTSGRAQNYAKKDAVHISAINASVPLFEKRLRQIRVRHGKDGMQPRARVDADGKVVRDTVGNPVRVTDANGRPAYESKYLEAYSLVQSFGHDELDPDDPESWARANDLGRAFAEDRFPGHPVLVATEINGRSGLVHNHLIVGAVHPETGKSLDSNVVTHARLAIAHDRVLEANGFVQRADMRAMVADAKRRMEEARDQVVAEYDGKVSPSQLQRRITAAQTRVKLMHTADPAQQQTVRPTVHQEREDRRQRELHRYEVNEQTRDAAREIGIELPKERFSEIVLESRIQAALSDPRSQSWDVLADVARTHGVTIAKRGQDVSYGMMLAQAEGAFAEPARAHMRRGRSLGDGYRIADVEAAIEQNAAQHRTATPRQKTVTMAQHLQAWRDSGDFDAEFERLRAEREEQASASADAVAAHDVPEAAKAKPYTRRQFESAPTTKAETAPSAFRSQLRGLGTSDSMRTRFTGLAALEEHWRGRLPSTPEERIAFEQQATKIGIGPAVLTRAEGHMGPELHAYLVTRAEHADEREKARERAQDLAKQLPELERRAKHDRLDHRGDAKKLREAKADLRFENGYVERLSADRAAGIYDSRKHERMEHLTKRNATQVAELEGHEPAAEPRQEQSAKPLTATEQRLRDRQAKQRKDNQKESKPQSQSMQM
ncbi:hypothetical protein QFZ53_002801 [Microbacterium natoriense]|uniref:MobA/VirD2-like nuclease domain-containing protein n=1 Tax=Microbacterium natoriense TaxID=284570 RepID=A0AAW8F0T7_9MICO|nr:relaxase/mobilization nuclease domain-containing protein [Microbacterium natoriense]MDQ0648605.1 hypothetical protein [Microbacterium natoriense]